MLAPARAEEQGERGRVDESDQAEVDGQVAHFGVNTLSVLGQGRAEEGFVAPIAVQLGSNRLCQGVFDRGGAVQVELASEDEDRCFAPITLEGERKIVLPDGPGLRPLLPRAPDPQPP